MNETRNGEKPNRLMIGVVRIVHTLIALVFIASIAAVYYSGIAQTIGIWFYLATGALAFEGIVVIANRGDCPLGFLHRRYGDDKGFFELFMPKRVARHMIRFFGALTAIGYVLVLVSMFL